MARCSAHSVVNRGYRKVGLIFEPDNSRRALSTRKRGYQSLLAVAFDEFTVAWCDESMPEPADLAFSRDLPKSNLPAI